MEQGNAVVKILDIVKLFKTSVLSGIITIIRVASGFVASKVVAIFTGPAGVALIGAFTNFTTITLTLANGAINTGVVKYASEYKGNDHDLKFLFSSALRISVLCSIIVGFILIGFAPTFSDFVLKSDSFAGPFRVLGVTIVLYSINSLFISILNGLGELKLFTIVNTVGSIAGLAFTVILVSVYNVVGALYALVLSQSLVFFVTTFFIIKSEWFKWEFFFSRFSVNVAKQLSKFSLMAIVSAVSVPVSQIVVRNILISDLGIVSAGLWQGMIRVSDGYLLLITTSLSTYYLPKLASLKLDSDVRKEILYGLKLILPVVFLGCIMIFLLRTQIVNILYTREFSEMSTLFLWQLVGDFFKVAAWIIGYQMVAKAMVMLYVVTDILFNLFYVLFSYYFVSKMGIQGVTVAFAVSYILYFLTMVFIFRKLLAGSHSVKSLSK